MYAQPVSLDMSEQAESVCITNSAVSSESADSWNKFSLVLICMLIIVTFLDLTGEKVRKSIRDKLGGK